jgi:hypothetical protein
LKARVSACNTISSCMYHKCVKKTKPSDACIY